MSDPDLAQLRLDHQREMFELRISHESEIRQIQRDFDDKARELQAIEYERRLHVLNNAHSDAIKAQSETVPREMFNTFKTVDAEWKAKVSQSMAEARGASARQTLIFTVVMALLAIVFKFWP